MPRTVTSWKLLRGSTRANRVMERISRHRHARDVLLRAVLQPGPVSVGRVSRHRHETDVL